VSREKSGSDEGSVMLLGRFTRPASAGFIISYDGKLQKD
jgi:hypothetical protein